MTQPVSTALRALALAMLLSPAAAQAHGIESSITRLENISHFASLVILANDNISRIDGRPCTMAIDIDHIIHRIGIAIVASCILIQTRAVILSGVG